MRPLSDADANAVLSSLGATAAPATRSGVRAALEFFARYMPDMDLKHRYSYMKAMDLTKPVATVDLLRGDEVAAVRYHATDLGEFHIRVGSDPARLGILLVGRQFRRYEVVQRVVALSSHVSALMHESRGPGSTLQLIIPDAARVLRATQRGTHTH